MLQPGKKKSGSVTRICIKVLVFQLINWRNQDELAGEIFEHEIVCRGFTWFRAGPFRFHTAGLAAGTFCRPVRQHEGQQD